MSKIYKTVKPAIKTKQYQKLGHIHNNNLIKMPKLAIKNLFSKDNANTELEFCKVYTLNKQYKIHNKEPFIGTTNKLGICLYTNLFGRRNILSGVGNYKYGVIFMNKVI